MEIIVIALVILALLLVGVLGLRAVDRRSQERDAARVQEQERAAALAQYGTRKN